MTDNTRKFKTGTTYYTRSIGDSDCIIKVTIKKRTPKTVQAIVHGRENEGIKRFRISIYEGEEQISPWGKYSMSPILGADDTKELKPSWEC